MLGAAARRALDRDLARLADGEREAFDAVYAAAAPLVRGLCLRLLADPADAEDAAQSALLKVFARASEYEAGRPALPWILGVAANECRSTRRWRERRREVAEVEAAAESDLEEALVRHDLLAAVRELIDQLDERDVETLRLALGERPPDPAFRKRLERSLSRLRMAWRSTHG